MKWTGMLVVSLRDVNFGFWSHLVCSGQNVIIFSHQLRFRLRLHAKKLQKRKNTLLGVCIMFGHTQIGLF